MGGQFDRGNDTIELIILTYYMSLYIWSPYDVLEREAMAKRGAKWIPVQAKSLSDRSRKSYWQYVTKFQEASALGQKLKETVTREWNAKFPDGINGQVCAFNALNGKLHYVMTPKKNAKPAAEKRFDEDSGDDVFG